MPNMRDGKRKLRLSGMIFFKEHIHIWNTIITSYDITINTQSTAGFREHSSDILNDDKINSTFTD